MKKNFIIKYLGYALFSGYLFVLIVDILFFNGIYLIDYFNFKLLAISGIMLINSYFLLELFNHEKNG